MSDDGIKRNAFAPTRRHLLKGSAAGAALGFVRTSALAQTAAASGLGAAFKGVFHIGAAVSTISLERQIERELAVLTREFTSLTPENCMKWQEIRPNNAEWRFGPADRLVELGTANGMYLVGHTLVWHSQVPRNIFMDASGAPLDRMALLERMEEHIDTLVGRYRGRLAAWDVVNEAIEERTGWRRSRWLEIIGEDFMEHAFRFAHAADPDARLLYNDYNMHDPRKRELVLAVLRDYLDRGVPIHGVGLQSHIGLDYPDMEEWEKSVAAYADLGLEVHVTELDVDVLPNPSAPTPDISVRGQYLEADDPYRDGLPEAVEEALAKRYRLVFEILLRYRPAVKRVTTWGLHDGISWKNDFPIRGRTNYPLLFDRDLRPKRAYAELLALAATL
ncbi:MAG TPA: endo-1,4-beta-xylanase [Gammaproteobacteria bacterium]